MSDQLTLLAQQAVPRLDSVYWVMLVSRILHILGAIILVGGLFYLRAVIMPPAAATGAASADQQFGGRRAAWAMWVGIASLLLLVTGLWNYLQIIRMHERLATSYHMLAGIKMLLGLALFFLAALLAGRSAAAQTLRQRLRFWLNVCLILGIVTVVMGSLLRTYPRTIKVDASTGPTLIAP
ncbi:MAG: hypothetical protein WD738_02100 [Pirellulales bacterium]